jgi:hypothetical protein
MKKIINNSKYFLYFKKQLNKIVAVFAIVSMFFGILNINQTLSYYSDVETSKTNSFSAAMFDILLTNMNINETLSPAFINEIDFDTNLLKVGESLKPQYKVSSVLLEGSNTAFCDAITLTATHSGFSYEGSLLGFVASTTTSLGTWEFDLELDKEKSNFPQGAKCDVNIRFDAWRDGIDTPEESGYTDTEQVEVRLMANMIVLNEFLPKPSGVAYGFDFGSDSSDMPQGEWVELYNNSDFETDLSDWYIWDGSGSELNKILITATNTVPATTIIPAHSWLVVYMNKSVLNNTGDTVKLFDNTNVLIDLYEYNSHDVCELEPTPADPNDPTIGVGVCSDVPPNKSYARIPDGVGSWVDPIPTPGEPNELIDQEFISTDISKITEVISEETTDTSLSDEEDSKEVNIEEPSTEESEIIKEDVTANPTEKDDVEIITTEELIQEPVVEETIEGVVPEESIEEVKEEEVLTEEVVVEEPVQQEEVQEIKVDEVIISE